MQQRLRARRVRFDLGNTPAEWIPGDPTTAHVINALHLILPPGERWFCRVLHGALPLVRDPALAADVRGFMAQEGSHARAHAPIVELLRSRGVDPTRVLASYAWLFEQLAADRPLATRWWHERLDRPWLVTRVGVIAAIEHLFCVLGTWILDDARALDATGADPAMLALLRWHGAEEVEHRAVVFDVYQHLGGSYAVRAFAVMIVLPLLLHLLARGADDLLRQRGRRFTWRAFWKAGRAGRLPTTAYLIRSSLRFLAPGYHPQHEGSSARALAYLDAAFA